MKLSLILTPRGRSHLSKQLWWVYFILAGLYAGSVIMRPGQGFMAPQRFCQVFFLALHLSLYPRCHQPPSNADPVNPLHILSAICTSRSRSQVLCPTPQEDFCPDPTATYAMVPSHPGKVSTALKLCWQWERGAQQVNLQGPWVVQHCGANRYGLG